MKQLFIQFIALTKKSKIQLPVKRFGNFRSEKI